MTNFLDRLHTACGGDISIGNDISPHYLRDFLKQYTGRALAVVRPHNTMEVAAVVRLCHDTRTPITPHGGNTGYCAGAIPDNSGYAIILSLEAMHTVRDINTTARTITVEAGCVLANVQQFADNAGLFFPLQLGAAGSCHIGGNLATNAGGVNVLRYGNARELCLGIEAVLPSGKIMNLLSSLHKNNTGYDLKNLLIGAEGTLGIITAAVLKLFRRPAHCVTAFAAVPNTAAALTLLNRCQESTNYQVESFEIIPAILFDLLNKHLPDIPLPFATSPPLAVLVEATAAEESINVQLQKTLEKALEKGLIMDAVIAASEAQRQQFWNVREQMPEATKREGQWIKMDVSLPTDKLVDFIDTVQQLTAHDTAGQYIIAFGHAGDGNLHLSLRPYGQAPKNCPAVMLAEKILAVVQEKGGSFSAEHGIGQTKKALLQRYKDPAAFAVMLAIKKALDPHNIMNPGKIIDLPSN